MELFLAQNHSALTHLPIAAAILAAMSAVAALFTSRKEKEIVFMWALLSITAFVTVLPTVATGVVAAKGRFNEDGKPYIEGGILVGNSPANSRILRHEVLGTTGSALAGVLALLGLAFLRGRMPNKYLIALLALALAVVWGLGGHLGGKEIWGADTFPALK